MRKSRFREQDFRSPRDSALFRELVQLNDPEVRRVADQLSRAAYKPLDQTPLLEDLVSSAKPASAIRPATPAAPAPQLLPVAVPVKVRALDSAPTADKPTKGRRLLAGTLIGAAAAFGLCCFGVGSLVWVASRNGPATSTGLAAQAKTNTGAGPQGAPLALGKADRLKGHTGRVWDVCWSPDGARLASGSGDQTVKIWNVTTGQVVLTLRGHPGEVRGVAWSPDGTRLASAAGDLNHPGKPHEVKVWDPGAGQDLFTLKGHTSDIKRVAWSPDGKRLASASADRTVKVWDTRTGRELLTLKGHTHYVDGVCWSPDGALLASASLDQTVKIWDATTGQEVHTLSGHTAQVYHVSWSPDGARLASASQDGTVKVWDARTGQVALTLKGHTNMVQTVTFSPDGRLLASGSEDQTVKLWDATTGKEALTLHGHTGPVYGAAFSPDGTRLASGSGDTLVIVWSLSGGSLNSPPPEGAAQPVVPPQGRPHGSLRVPLAKEITNGIGMNLVRVPEGTFWMGERGSQKKVTVGEDFYLGVYPVTQEQWQAVMRNNPSYFSRNGGGGGKVKDVSDADLRQFPVESVSWDDAQQSIEKLNSREGNGGLQYRLPTEAEWEYACRAGATSPEDCAFGFYLDRPTNDLSSDQANFNGNIPAGNAPKGKYLERTTKVGSYPPNRLGIYDMHGNVWEWCANLYVEGGGPARDFRGGCWHAEGVNCRASIRCWNRPTYRYVDLGFRLAAAPAGE